MDKRTVESLCSIRGTPEIVNILTCEIDENAVGQGTKASLKGMLQAVVTCLVWERDNGKIQMNFKAIKDATTLEGMMRMSRKGGGSADMRAPVMHYLMELPGFDYDAVDAEGNLKEGFKSPRFKIDGARSMHDYFRSLFVNPAEKVGL